MIPLLCALSLAGPQASSDGELRVILTAPPDLTVDGDGTHTGQGLVVDTRLRVGAHLELGDDLAFHTEWDLGRGQLVGDTWGIPGDLDERHREAHQAVSLAGIVPRRLSVSGTLGPVDLEAGLMTTHWGLGVLANDGAHDPLFGRSDFGDRVFRVRAMTAPWGESHLLPLFFIAAVDVVAADDLARFSQDQLAIQGVLATLFRDYSDGSYGLYGVYRHQREAEVTRTTDVGVVDVFVDKPVPVGSWTLRLAGEGAAIVGRTNRATSYNSRDKLAVQAAGVGIQTSLAAPEDRAVVHLRAGWASGDGDPDDGYAREFVFDRDYDVGMVLFDEIGAAREAGLANLVTDPSISGRPPDGYDTITSEGAFRHAVYLQPAVTTAPVEQLELRLGAVLAWSTSPPLNAFYTVRGGGTPHNHLDEPIDGYAMGTEVDWAVRLHPGDADEGWWLKPDLLIQGGHAFLAEAFAGSGPRTAHLVLATARARW